MPGKDLVTETCVRRMAPGAELVLGPNKIATPAALDLCFERGIQVRREGEAHAHSAGGDCGCDKTCLWSQIKATDGTYVVTVSAGRAVVVRVDQASPQPFGEE